MRTLSQDGAARILHEVVWWQPFPNANHRTALAATLEDLNIDVAEEVIRDIADPYFAKSKALLDGSDQRLTNQEAKEAHLELMDSLVNEIQSSK